MQGRPPPCDTAPVEVERKWLVDEAPDLADAPAWTIHQGYVAVAEDGAELRVRRRDATCLLTVKHGRGLVREETECEIGAALFDALWAQTSGRRVEKVRSRLDLADGLVAEVDVFGGALAGLVLVEVEFPSEADAARFVTPAWFGREVTDDPAYKNQALALSGPPQA